jgi:hypothetical protein
MGTSVILSSYAKGGWLLAIRISGEIQSYCIATVRTARKHPATVRIVRGHRGQPANPSVRTPLMTLADSTGQASQVDTER